jgi:hypothetical protein
MVDGNFKRSQVKKCVHSFVLGFSLCHQCDRRDNQLPPAVCCPTLAHTRVSMCATLLGWCFGVFCLSRSVFAFLVVAFYSIVRSTADCDVFAAIGASETAGVLDFPIRIDWQKARALRVCVASFPCASGNFVFMLVVVVGVLLCSYTKRRCWSSAVYMKNRFKRPIQAHHIRCCCFFLCVANLRLFVARNRFWQLKSKRKSI